MRRKVSLWIVVALVGALAATTAAVIVLATNDDRGAHAVAGGPSNDAWPQASSQRADERQLPMMDDVRGAWDDGHDAPILPWVLFALATGTAVGLLIAWSPWRAAPASAGADAPDDGGGTTTTAIITEPASEAPPAVEATAEQAPIDAQWTDALTPDAAEPQTEAASQAPPES